MNNIDLITPAFRDFRNEALEWLQTTQPYDIPNQAEAFIERLKTLETLSMNLILMF